MFDADFQYASYMNGDYITLALRIDERKVSPAIVNKFVQKEEERIKAEKQIPKISRSQHIEIKERITTELTRKAVPVPSVYELCWNLAESTIIFFSTNKKAQAVIEDFFKESFGLLLKQQVPFVVAEGLLDTEEFDRLARMTPEIFV